LFSPRGAPPYFESSCNETEAVPCESLKIADITVIFQASGPSEQMNWQAGGLYFSLIRNAGIPGKNYKDELLKGMGSLK
jgi:hypothetical protein